MLFIVFRFLIWANKLLMLLWNHTNHLIWRLNGTARKIEAKVKYGETENPAQVLRVVFKNPTLQNLHASPLTYFTAHERFAPAEIVLQKNMHLLSITSTAAMFTELDCDLLNVREHPLAFISHTNHTIRLIILPIKSFYALVDKIDVNDINVVWMFHTTRCGSTAWVQAFHSLPGWIAFSEPQALQYSILYGDHGYHSAESFSRSPQAKRLTVAYIKMYLRHSPPGGSVFWKAMSYEEYFIDIISENFPHHRFIAAYRDAFPSITSFYRSFHSSAMIRYTSEVLLNHDPSDDEWWFHIPNVNFWTNGCDHHFCKKVITAVRPRTCVEWYLFMYAAKVAAIKRAMQNGIKMKPIKYDSMLQDRRDTVTKVITHLGLPSHFVDTACEALNFDSQAGIAMVSWDTRKKDGATEWSKDPAVVKRCNMILEAFGLPDLQTSIVLDGSI